MVITTPRIRKQKARADETSVDVEGVKQREDKIDEVWIVQPAGLAEERRLVRNLAECCFDKAHCVGPADGGIDEV
jgi:hypothetical protein